MSLSNLPPKGTADWFPDELRIRHYIFDTWRKICQRFGYQEYLTPLVEHAEVYRVKSGEDVGGSELTTFTDRAGRELAIRPEMTPSVTRLVTRIFRESPKPLRLFSIANFMRNEKPQRGRNREFWQLNYDLFGSDALGADLEIVQIALEIMLAFGPPKDSFVVYLNHRKLIDGILQSVKGISEQNRTAVVRILDKWDKLSQQEYQQRLQQLGLKEGPIRQLSLFMESESEQQLLENLPFVQQNEGFQQLHSMVEQLSTLGFANWVQFRPNVIRGFDYYDGVVFETFDHHPENKRSMFGGGRYNGLASIFGNQEIPGVGCAPGDETTKLFLESWNLLPQKGENTLHYFLPLLEEKLLTPTQKLAAHLRSQGHQVTLGLEPKRVGKAIDWADKAKFQHIALLGEEEWTQGSFLLKNMSSGEEEMRILPPAMKEYHDSNA